jgi:uncharacterized protein with FMN-binding domain
VKRLSIWIASTAVLVVLLFSYHTSTSGPGGTKAVAGIAPVGVVAEPPVAPPPVGPTAPTPHRSSSGTSPSTATALPAPSRVAASAPRTASPAGAAPPRPAATQAAPAPSRAPAAPSTRTINGAPADTRYGPVQVQIKVRGRRIVSSNAIVYPTSERRDREINDYAVPQLNDETVKAQSAGIDTVSGATYTSDGYRQSLQSALDAAGL